MLEVFLVLATVTSLIILYKFLPNRKIFMYFCLSLVVVFTIAGLIARSQQPQESMNEAERYVIQERQKIFTAWYTNYQKDIDQLDINWQLYHNIIENFSSDNIDSEELHDRLMDLEKESRIEQVNIYTLKPPPDVGDECNAMIEEMLRKTQRYVDAQAQTIALTRSAVEEEGFLTAKHNEQIHMLQNIIIREAPTGLFTANELSAILKYFTLPEDFPDDNKTKTDGAKN